MNILIFGGNRYFGKLLIMRLLQNKKINIFVVNRAQKKNIKNKNVILLKSDRNDINYLKKNIGKTKFDFVIDNSAYNFKTISNFYRNFKKNIGRYIFSSTVMVYFDTSFKLIAKENDLNKFTSKNLLKLNYNDYEIEYAKNKKKAEDYIKQNINCYSIFRIHNVIGKNDFSRRTEKLFYFNPSHLKNQKNFFIQFCYIEDLIDCYMKLIFSNNISKQNIYNVTNKPVSINYFFKLINKYIRVKKYKTNNIFPLPINNLMDNSKICDELNIKFSTYKKIVKSFV